MAKDPFTDEHEVMKHLQVGRPHMIIYFNDGTQRKICFIDSWYIQDNFLIIDFEDGKQ